MNWGVVRGVKRFRRGAATTGRTCTCCIYGHVGGHLCVECQTYHELIGYLERGHRLHHEDTKAAREDLYRLLVSNPPLDTEDPEE